MLLESFEFSSDAVNMRIDFAKIVSLIGPNASGKTLLLHWLMRTINLISEGLLAAPLSKVGDKEAWPKPSRLSLSMRPVDLHATGKLAGIFGTDPIERIIINFHQLRDNTLAIKSIETSGEGVLNFPELYAKPELRALIIEAKETNGNNSSEEVRKLSSAISRFDNEQLDCTTHLGKPAPVLRSEVSVFLSSLGVRRAGYFQATDLASIDYSDLIQKAAENNDGPKNEKHFYNRVVKELGELLESDIDIYGVNNPKIKINGRVSEVISYGTDLCLKFYSLLHSNECGIVLWDEPENGLHQTRQHKLLEYMKNDRSVSSFIIATHTPVLAPVNDSSVHIYRCASVYEEDGTLKITTDGVESRGGAFRILEELGVRPSDILFTANTVIWVEGPTEIVLWSHLIKSEAPDLTAGFDYSFLMFGGSNIDKLTLEDEPEDLKDDMVDVFSISRHAAVLVDSDVSAEPADWGKPEAYLKPAALRMYQAALKACESRADAAIFINTRVREIENLLPDSAIRMAVSKLASLTDPERAKAKLETLSIGKFERYHKAIAAHLMKNGVTVKNNKGEQVAKGKSKWGSPSKVSFMREAIATGKVSVDTVENSARMALQQIINWIRKHRNA